MWRIKMFKNMTLCLIMFALLGGAGILGAQNQDSKAIIGKIGDKTYTYAEYDGIWKNYQVHHTGAKAISLSDAERAKLNNQCWEELIGRYVYDAEIKRRKLKASDAELEAEVKRNPPDAVKQIKDLWENKRFSKAKFEKALAENPDFRRSVLDYLNQTYIYTKLYSAIKSEVKADADSVRRDWFKDNDTADAKIVYFDYNKLSQLKSDEAEAFSFYEANKEDYRRENGRNYRFVRFAKEASASDSLLTKALVDSIYQAVANGADFAALATKYSRDPGSAAKGGDLGYFTRGRMVKPFEDAAFATAKGQVAEPVQSQFGWHIIQVTDRRLDANGKEEVQARHILIKTEMSEERMKQMKNAANELYQTAFITGLVPAAALLDYKVMLSPFFGEKERSIQGVGSDPNLVAFAFGNPVGTLHSLYTAANGDMFVLELGESVDVYYTPFEREKNAIVSKLTLNKKLDAMRKIANDFYANTAPQDYFAQAAADSIAIIEATNIKKGGQLPTIGKIDVLTDAILALEAGEYSKLINHNNYWYLAHVSQRTKPDPKDWEKQKKELIGKAQESLQQKHLNSWYYARKNELKIEDNRKDFYDLSSSNTGRSIQLSP